MKRNFCTNFGVFLPKLKYPNMVMYYLDEKSTLVSAVLKIGIPDPVETTPRSILHMDMSIL